MKTPEEKESTAAEIFRLALIYVIMLAVFLFGVRMIAEYMARTPIVHARTPTFEQKVALMDEVYTRAVENNIREMGKEK